MQTETIVLILAAISFAFIIAWFQYFYKIKQRTKRNRILFVFRFFSVFVLLLLIINPTFRKKTYRDVKPTLALAVDNSASILNLDKGSEVTNSISRFKNNKALNQKYDLKIIAFSASIEDSLSLSFKGNQTNIEKTLNELDQLYKGIVAPVVLVTDGNQTVGKDYTYSGPFYKQQIFPVIAGDTIATGDSQIEQINVNRYAFLKNEFPVEVILTNTNQSQQTFNFKIVKENKTVFSKKINFIDYEGSKIINVNLPANSPGVQKYSAILEPNTDEKNKVNNRKNFAVEVIDQKTKVLLLSSIVHPDLGAYKKSVETAENRTVDIKTPKDKFQLEDYQMILLYQPDYTFKTVFSTLNELKKNYLVVTGVHTNWNFLNTVQNLVSQEITGQKEYFQPRLNTAYSSFLVDANTLTAYPPLEGAFGSLKLLKSGDILMHRTIDNIETAEPLVVTFDLQQQRTGFLMGEGFWKWRSFVYTQTKSFDEIDQLFSKIVQYLSSTKKRSRLTANSESFYYSNTGVLIKADYFTKNYEFDRRGKLTLTITNNDKTINRSVPMLLRENSYQVELSDLPPGDYDYTITVTNESLSVSDSFSILEYDVEKQAYSANLSSLRQLASDTNGKVYTIDQIENLVQDLIEDKRYQIIQKSKVENISLIDWKMLLGILILLLAIEWFVRKYNGLI